MPFPASEFNSIFFSLFNNSVDPVVISHSYGGHLIGNAAACEMFGYTSEELSQLSASALVDLEDRQSLQFRSERAPDGSAKGALELIRKDGSRFQALILSSVFKGKSGDTYTSWTLRQVSAKHELEQHLSESKARYDALIDAMEEGVLVQDADNNIFACNRSTLRILGFSEAAIKVRNDAGSAWKPCLEDGTPIPTEELPSIRALRTGQPVRNFPVQIVRGNGDLAWVRVSSVPLFREGNPKPYLVVTSFVDITGLKQNEHELVSQASTDALTGLANRRAFAAKGGEFFKAAVAGAELAAIIIDVDHFKTVNDKYGHAVGDEVLKRVADRLKAYTRGADLVVRTGGEEFCILLPDTSGGSALAIAERIRVAFASAPILQVGQESLTVTLSAGLVSHKRGVDESLTALLSRGDSALYQAKHTGRNRVVTLD